MGQRHIALGVFDVTLVINLLIKEGALVGKSGILMGRQERTELKLT